HARREPAMERQVWGQSLASVDRSPGAALAPVASNVNETVRSVLEAFHLEVERHAIAHGEAGHLRGRQDAEITRRVAKRAAMADQQFQRLFIEHSNRAP